ncbi:DUF4344 domain-containing metallopeptidase [Mycolicibacterium grossiae]|nr:DUF4344 domain-containing metallopeptidase [Mycolicibacterium grossiae]QEM44539.1 hypothetical protein FZ046_06835 [Mycolicibacterium grossiae]
MTTQRIWAGRPLWPLAVCAVLLAGCSSDDAAGPSEVTAERPGPATTAVQADAAAPEPADGRMIVRWDEATSQEAIDGRKLLQDNQVLDTMAQDADDLLKLPQDIQLIGAQCDEPNAFWSPEDRAMTICYEDPMSGLDIFTKAGDVDPVASAVGVEIATFFHEMGHMTIDLYDLPATGREEDVADQLAAFMLLQPDDDGTLDPDDVKAVVDSAREWDYYGQLEDEVDDDAFADEHSLNETRKFNLLCWVYGADPEGQAYLVDQGMLPERRAERCEDEWFKLDRAWSTLLGPHLKD